MRGIDMVAAERRRQMKAEGWTAAHDDEHTDGELAAAALAYLMSDYMGVNYGLQYWPWTGPADEPSFKPRDKMQNLVRAGALIVAEIERLQRRAKSGQSDKP